jgi:uncharacterized protein (TIGR00725 family)
MPVVTIFGSAAPRPGEPEYLLAHDLGTALATAGFVVCNGGFGGTMEASARGAKEAGGKTIGITVPVFQQDANRFIDRVIPTHSLFDRLKILIDTGDAYVVLKGSTGTLLELAAVWELLNKRLMEEKPVVLLGDFWNNVVELLRDEATFRGTGKISTFIRTADTPDSCVKYLRNHSKFKDLL